MIPVSLVTTADDVYGVHVWESKAACTCYISCSVQHVKSLSRRTCRVVFILSPQLSGQVICVHSSMQTQIRVPYLPATSQIIVILFIESPSRKIACPELTCTQLPHRSLLAGSCRICYNAVEWEVVDFSSQLSDSAVSTPASSVRRLRHVRSVSASTQDPSLAQHRPKHVGQSARSRNRWCDRQAPS